MVRQMTRRGALSEKFERYPLEQAGQTPKHSTSTGVTP